MDNPFADGEWTAYEHDGADTNEPMTNEPMTNADVMSASEMHEHDQACEAAQDAKAGGSDA